MSNLIKSGFVAFAQKDAIVIDANKNHVIENRMEASKEDARKPEHSEFSPETEEEALAAALIRDVGLDDDAEVTFEGFDEQNSFGHITEDEVGERAEEILREARQEAESILNQAHEEVERTRAAAYDEAQQIRQQAHEEGYQSGYSEGEQQVRVSYQEKENALEDMIAGQQEELLKQQEKMVQETEEKMVQMLCQLIPRITGVVIEDEQGVLLHIVNMAMRDMENSDKFVIRVSNADYPVLVEHKNEIYGALNPNISLEIFEDAKLNPMQCLIDTDNGIVDVSLDTQLHNIIRALKLMIQK